MGFYRGFISDGASIDLSSNNFKIVHSNVSTSSTNYTVTEAGLYFATVSVIAGSSTGYPTLSAAIFCNGNAVSYPFQENGKYEYDTFRTIGSFLECVAGDVINLSAGATYADNKKYCMHVYQYSTTPPTPVEPPSPIPAHIITEEFYGSSLTTTIPAPAEGYKFGTDYTYFKAQVTNMNRETLTIDLSSITLGYRYRVYCTNDVNSYIEVVINEDSGTITVYHDGASLMTKHNFWYQISPEPIADPSSGDGPQPE